MQKHSNKFFPLRQVLALSVAAALLGAATWVVAQRPRAAPVRLVPTGPYVAAAIRPSASQADQDAAVQRFYAAWKSAFLREGCGDGAYRVYSPDAAYPYVAEAQGYGLVITASMAGRDPEARTFFDGILRYVLAHPSVNDPALTAAEQNADCSDVGGGDSATDGDLDIAYALLLAHKQWGSGGGLDYRALALRRIHAIKRSEVNPSTRLMLLGDWSKPGSPLYRTSRTSDWMAHHFRAFRAATGDSEWDAILSAHQKAIVALQATVSPETGLLPDFVQAAEGGVVPVEGKVLESDYDGAYYFNACRDPWRIGLDAITSGDKASLTAARNITAWAVSVTGGDPRNIGTGYTLAGERLSEQNDPAFWAPLAVAAMTDPGGQAWLDALWTMMAGARVEAGSYFGATIQLQAMLIVTGRYVPV
ncbi:glycosyl hydrolase family 8 [Spirilliplanes yamanashiensis]|uniref:Glucanase n=1 Tax=Spirilliplanes yamanashiensis TaxID=42233 RepID=A0A8J4DLJ2_9ACTN|nr:glycosyl hydrolase family 8 [Spirilliplanes yamanashiensis]MDP9818445.1 endo-1,4-beta-D-glucanase Y [Spirilliplanes yamanashiensis]GIJ06432.1 licheninase [Spirilliplanes yamanashiensis]